MSRFVVSCDYGRLVDGWRASDAALRLAVLNSCFGQHNAAEIALHQYERAQWQAAMRRCPVFVGAAA